MIANGLAKAAEARLLHRSRAKIELDAARHPSQTIRMLLRRVANDARLDMYSACLAIRAKQTHLLDCYEVRYEAKVPSKVINSYFGLIICILYHIITYEDRIYIHLLNTRNIIRYSKLIANDEA